MHSKNLNIQQLVNEISSFRLASYIACAYQLYSSSGGRFALRLSMKAPYLSSVLYFYSKQTTQIVDSGSFDDLQLILPNYLEVLGVVSSSSKNQSSFFRFSFFKVIKITIFLLYQLKIS